MKKSEGYKYTGDRITGLFGKNMPPRKKKKYKGYLPMHFLLKGTVPSKKNEWVPATNFRAVRNRADKSKPATEVLSWISERIKCYIRPNNKFKAWEKETIQVLVEQAAHYSKKYEKYGILFPITDCSLSMYCYWASNTAKDNINKLESVQDILVDSGILSSDCWQNLNPVKVESELYSGEITENIFVITIMINLKKSTQELKEEVLSGMIPQRVEVKKTDPQIKDSKLGIEQVDLISLGWFSDYIDEDTNEEVTIDLTPSPRDWDDDVIEQLIEWGYDIDDLKEFYTV